MIENPKQHFFVTNVLVFKPSLRPVWSITQTMECAPTLKHRFIVAGHYYRIKVPGPPTINSTKIIEAWRMTRSCRMMNCRSFEGICFSFRSALTRK